MLAAVEGMPKNIANSGGAIIDNRRRNESVGREEEEEREECSREFLKEDEVESAKAEMTEVREENARLKMLLHKIEKDYKSLQMRFADIFQPETNSTTDQEPIEEPELVFLCLGRNPTEAAKKDDCSSVSSKAKEDQHLKEGLKLGLNYDSEEAQPDITAKLNPNPSPENSLVETKEEEAGETWPPSKVSKPTRSADDDLSQASVKRARVSVRARCDTPTMNDGCQWRKYGQKIAKGNPCPRAYYRCTVATSCPVRKQVQRCAEDMSILITTYEGTHNHPLPISARAMASTTSSAASMLLSGSSSSQSGLGSATTTNLRSTFHGPNVNPSDNSKTPSFYLPNSTSPLFPTITLDLTTSTPASTSNHFNVLSTSFHLGPRFSCPNLSFSPSQTNLLPTIWSNGNLNYGTVLPHNKTHIGSMQPGRPSQEHLYQPNLPKNCQLPLAQQVLTQTLTKAITSDPSLRAVVTAALSTMVGEHGSSGPAQANNVAASFGTHLKWDGQTKILPSNPLISNGKASEPA